MLVYSLTGNVAITKIRLQNLQHRQQRQNGRMQVQILL